MDKNSSDTYLDIETDGFARRFPMSVDKVCRIGRGGDNDIVLDHHLISRNHAVIQSSAGSFLIFDLGSRNGTLLNGQRLQGTEALRDGDRVRVGGIDITFHETVREATPEPAFFGSNSTRVDLAPSLVTVLVVDIRDSTLLARRLDSDTLSKLMGALFHESGKTLHACGAWTQKYIGDAVMAVWLHERKGANVAREMPGVLDGLLNVVEIAGALQSRFSLDEPVRVGAGINSGWASVGNVGSIAAADFTATGEVVHRAFRLESATRDADCDLLISNETCGLLKESAGPGTPFRKYSVELKGYDEQVEAWGLSFDELRQLRKA